MRNQAEFDRIYDYITDNPAKWENDRFLDNLDVADFDYIINELKSVYPLESPWDKNMEECFDFCGNNYFDNKTCRKIIEKIEQKKTDEPKVMKFKKEIIEWFNDKLKYADYIVVYGNL